MELESAGITVATRRFQTQDDPAETVNDLFVRTCQGSFSSVVTMLQLQLENEDYRIFFINSYTPPARKIICEVKYYMVY